MEKIKSTLTLEIYRKGDSTWFCEYYFYNGISYEEGTTKASGYGYDKHSTATSNAINKFKFLYKFKNGLKWDGAGPVTTKQNNILYGIYKDRSISYGIGISSVLNCLNAFSNVKIKAINYGNRCDFVQLEITTTQNYIQKELAKNQKIVNDRKANKYNKKEAIKTIEKIEKLFNLKS